MHNSFLHLLLKNGDFLNTDISQGSVATRSRCGGGIYISLRYKFSVESNSERILKIGKYLVKLLARVRCLVFLTRRVSCGQPAIECTRSACDHISLMTSRYYRTGRYIAHL